MGVLCNSINVLIYKDVSHLISQNKYLIFNYFMVELEMQGVPEEATMSMLV